MPKQRLEMTPGVKYRGYGMMNSFGEFEFTPEQTGIRKGKRRFIKQGDNFSVSETVNNVLVHMAFEKQKSKMELMKEYLKVTNSVLEVLRDYEI